MGDNSVKCFLKVLQRINGSSAQDSRDGGGRREREREGEREREKRRKALLLLLLLLLLEGRRGDCGDGISTYAIFVPFFPAAAVIRECLVSEACVWRRCWLYF